MTLNERERFLYHLSVLMTMDAMKKDVDVNVDEMLYAIWKNRCRKLTESDIKDIYNEVEEEAMNGTSVYEEFSSTDNFETKKGSNDDLR
jgi:hypothetical protein